MLKYQNRKSQRYEIFVQLFQQKILEQINEGKLLRQIQQGIYQFFYGNVSKKMLHKYTQEVVKCNGCSELVKRNVATYNKQLASKNIKSKIDKCRNIIDESISGGMGSIRLQKVTGISRWILRRQLPEYSQFFIKQDKLDCSKAHKRYNERQFKTPRYQRYRNSINTILSNNEYLTIGNIENHIEGTCTIYSKQIMGLLKELNLLERYYDDNKRLRRLNAKKNGEIGNLKTQQHWEEVRKKEYNIIEPRIAQLVAQGKHRTLIQKLIISQFPEVHKQNVIKRLNKLTGIIVKYHNCDYYRNSMYGRSPSVKSGYGCKGWVLIGNKELFFRSSLELKIFVLLDSKGIPFCISKHRVPYSFKGRNRTYLPDIQLQGIVYEIKPKNLQKTAINLIKMEAAKQYLKKFNLSYGYLDQSLLQNQNQQSLVKEYYKCGKIIFASDKDKEKYNRYNKGYSL